MAHNHTVKLFGFVHEHWEARSNIKAAVTFYYEVFLDLRGLTSQCGCCQGLAPLSELLNFLEGPAKPVTGHLGHDSEADANFLSDKHSRKERLFGVHLKQSFEILNFGEIEQESLQDLTALFVSFEVGVGRRPGILLRDL